MRARFHESVGISVTKIDQRVEAEKPLRGDYGREFTEDQIAQRRHRKYVGGHWDSMGRLQLDFLTSRGLRRDHLFLDVGCGSFRAGSHLIDYLDPGHYYGIDINPNIIRAGYENELTEDQRGCLPQNNLRATDRFDADFGATFDMAIAQSMFTHISLNHIRLCLYRVAKVMRPGSVFYATFYDEPAGVPLDTIKGRRHTERNTFWYYRGDMRWAASFSPWKLTYIGEWGHPRGQKMLKFTRVEDRPTHTARTPRPRQLVKRLVKRRVRKKR